MSFVFCCKQKTAYEVRISDWSSDVCSSDLVRISDGPGPVDPQYGPYRSIGREGVVWRLCSSVFADHCRVFLDPVGAERAEKIVFIEIRDIEPLASSASSPPMSPG